MAATCEAHPFQEATGTCRSCSGSFCPECLVYAFGPKRPPLCIPCALTAAGVRSTARRRRSPRKRTKDAAPGLQPAEAGNGSRSVLGIAAIVAGGAAIGVPAALALL